MLYSVDKTGKDCTSDSIKIELAEYSVSDLHARE